MSCSSTPLSPVKQRPLPEDLVAVLQAPYFVQTDVGFGGNSEITEYPILLTLTTIAQMYKISYRMDVAELLLFHFYNLLQHSSTPLERRLAKQFVELSFKMMCSLKDFAFTATLFGEVSPSSVEKVKSTAEEFSNLMTAIEKNYPQSTEMKDALFIIKRLLLDGRAHERIHMLQQLVCPSTFYPSSLWRTYPFKDVFNDLKTYYVFQMQLFRSTPKRTQTRSKKYQHLHNLLSSREFQDFFENSHPSFKQLCIKSSPLAAKCLAAKSKENASSGRAFSPEYVGVELLIMGGLDTIEDCLNAQNSYSHQVSFKRFFRYIAQFSNPEEEVTTLPHPAFRSLESDTLRISQLLANFIKNTYIAHLDLYQKHVNIRLENLGAAVPRLKELKIEALRGYLYTLREDTNRIFEEVQLELKRMKDRFIERLATTETPMTEEEIQTAVEEITTNLAFYLTIIMDARRICGDEFAVENIDQYVYPKEFLNLLSVNYAKYIRPAPSRVSEIPEEESSQATRIPTEVSASPSPDVAVGGSSIEEENVRPESPLLEQENRDEATNEISSEEDEGNFFVKWQKTLEDHFPGIGAATDEAKLLKLINKRFTPIKKPGSHKGGSHRLYRDNETGKTVLLAAHDSTALIKKGTLHKIRKSLRQVVISELTEQMEILRNRKEEDLATLRSLVEGTKGKKAKEKIEALRKTIIEMNQEIQSLEAKINGLS